ncbi:PD-(D/E)XK nuclease superfamily protein [Roseovarius litorisediminis]|uniref:PD-(D/E)XK nuclease superfamily protein n=1 Tax=Roseovarius litorisediminis TaxID=1312363 RepID=A0A1Y5SM17_9RHOB|nr:double-strand break repair protein AddB [Roseovarius litorisediminis]SLN43837.1 PD-(D/E)XK nuclease superfamily protein [Roseovarius litorisediminis]
MFDPSDQPRVFGLPPGVDFPKALVDGLRARHTGATPDALARVQLIVNTRRMARRIRTLFDTGPALLLPRINLITDLGEHWDLAHIPDPVPPLRRRLELVQLVSTLLERQPDLAPRSAIFDLADSLAGLMDEMHGEGVSPDVIDDLDVTDQSGHWARIKSFLGIVRHYFEAEQDQPDVETRQRMVIEHVVQRWQETPPDHPIIIAGSTGSRGATQVLMQAVAKLPQGAVILPGFDFDMPGPVWGALDDPMLSEDHPQYRFHRFASALGVIPGDIPRWTPETPANPARNRVISLALRPAPVTDQWLKDGPKLHDLASAMRDISLVEAPSTRIEALAIAMRLRRAAEDGQTAALITPDRMLTRQVTAALDRWNILPDDSAGVPLHLSPPGRFLRHVAQLFRQRLTAEALLTLLKHPLTHSGCDRGPHLRLTRELELHLRRHGPPYPTADDLRLWAETQKDPIASQWANWLTICFTDREDPSERQLAQRVTDHIALAERISQGSQGDGTGKLWTEGAGRDAQAAITELAGQAPSGGALNAMDYNSLFHRLLAQKEVRDPTTPHPKILIWGTLEARVQGADLLILAGLNEGSWPETPKPDPWLNRALRHQAGLLLPERRIGLSAHDFQQAVAAPEVWLTRSIRSDDAETVVSRWLNRLQNLLSGLPDQGGKQALDDMRARGQKALAQVALLEAPGYTEPATRPAPCPPPAARPAQLSVTEIKRLIRDPYAIYAKHVLGLRPLDPLMKVPDALLRGIVLHEVLEQFIRETLDDPTLCTKEALMEKAVSVLAKNVPWAEARAMWLARMDRVADWFIDTELVRRSLADPARFEARGAAELSDLGFTLTATADRIDIDGAGNLHIYDYKTGTPPTKDQQLYFDRQLLLEAAIAEIAGFGEMAPAKVERAVYIGLASGGKEVHAPLQDAPTEKVWREFHDLIAAYMAPDKGYTARRAMHSKRDHGDYDQLARFGEWDITDDPVKTGLG